MPESGIILDYSVWGLAGLGLSDVKVVLRFGRIHRLFGGVGARVCIGVGARVCIGVGARVCIRT